MNEEIQKLIKSSKRTQRIGIIDGVKVVHTGRRHYIHKGILMGINGKKKNLGYELVEVLEKYDVNGNRLYSNCSSQEEAEKLVEELEKEGKKALIGPVAPDYKGRSLKDRCPEWVGVYIVK